jgi:hypothetical protein
MMEVFAQLGLSYGIINDWDAEQISCHESLDLISLDLWTKRLPEIADILYTNSLFSSGSLNCLTDTLHNCRDMPQWMMPRKLSRGEISVLLKHFTAILRISLGFFPYGIILEDDILLHKASVNSLASSLKEFVVAAGDYIDLAGGAGLSISSCSRTNGNIVEMRPPRTRTNAAYCISKRLATYFTYRFFPLCMPIDWHLQYLLSSSKDFSVYWTIRPPLLHGSETGLVKSWRLDV